MDCRTNQPQHLAESAPTEPVSDHESPSSDLGHFRKLEKKSNVFKAQSSSYPHSYIDWTDVLIKRMLLSSELTFVKYAMIVPKLYNSWPSNKLAVTKPYTANTCT